MVSGVMVVQKNFRSITSELILAVDEEIRAIKSSGGSDRVGVHAGKYCGEVGDGRFIYKFILDSELFVPTDTPGRLQVGNSSYEVAIVSIEDLAITLSTSKLITGSISTATLSFSPYYILERLKERLSELDGSSSACHDMPMRLIGGTPNRPFSERTVPESEGGNLNEEQLAAVNRSLSQSITFIWGPPGTGKTHTIGKLVEELVNRGERVLLTSHTNVAVDTALEKAVEKLSSHPVGIVIRVGDPSSSDSGLRDYYLDRVVEKKGESLRMQKADLEKRLRPFRITRDYLTDAAKLVDALEEAERAAITATAWLSQAENRVNRVRKQLELGNQSLERLENLLKKAEDASWIRQILFGLNPDKIRFRILAQGMSINEVKSELRDAEHDRSTAIQNLQQAQAALETAKRKLATAVPDLTPDEIRKRLDVAEKTIKELGAEIASVDAQLRQLAATAIMEARVVGATLSRFVIADELVNTPFDTIIVDEVSMVLMPYLWFVATKAKKRLVVSGDFLQLPPISIADDPKKYPMAAKWLAKDPFEICKARPRLGNAQDPRLCSLKAQYRMHPDIGEVANELVYSKYGNPLEHKISQSQKMESALGCNPCPGEALVLCDTSRANPWCALQDPTWSRYNIYSAIVCVRLASEAIASGAGDVGIVTPYRAQAKLIQSLVEHEGLHEHDVSASTVHRYQGKEKEVIILDLVEGPPLWLGRLLKGGVENEGARLLNVACTRAIGKLVVVAHMEYVLQKAGRAPVLLSLLEHFRNEAQYVDVRSLVEGYADPGVGYAIRRMTGKPSDLGDPKGISYFDEGTFYPAFTDDLMAASEQVLIYSPFVAPKRLSGLMIPMRHLVEQGVSVTVVVRAYSPSDISMASIEEQMREVGIAVIPKRGLHEKLVFIDERVAWFGSLNVLSQSRSTEFMMRLAEPDFVTRLMECTGASSILREEERRRRRAKLLSRLEETLSAKVGSPVCPVHGVAMALRSGKYGPFFGCPKYQDENCKETVNIPRAILESAVQEWSLLCSECGYPLTLVFSRSGHPFLGCSGYPDCKWTASL